MRSSLRTASLAAAILLASAARPFVGTASAQMPPTSTATPVPSHVTPGPVGPIPGVGEAPSVANPYLHDQSALMQGRRYFNQFNCSGCHGGHGGGGMGPSLRDTTWIYGGTDEDIFDSISQGRAHGMPAWGAMLPADVLWKLAAYIAVMRTADEPEPPE